MTAWSAPTLMTDPPEPNEAPETTPITLAVETITRRRHGTAGNQASHGRPVDHEFRLRFAELAERDESMALTVARIESTAATSQLQLHEQLQGIMSALTQLTEISMDVQTLRHEMQEKRHEHDFFRNQEKELQQSIEGLSQHIVHLEQVNKALRHRQFWLDVHSVVLLVLTLVVVYHVFFGHY